VLVYTSVLAALWSIHSLRSELAARDLDGRLFLASGLATRFAAPLLVPPSLVVAWAYLLLAADWLLVGEVAARERRGGSAPRSLAVLEVRRISFFFTSEGTRARRSS